MNRHDAVTVMMCAMYACAASSSMSLVFPRGASDPASSWRLCCCLRHENATASSSQCLRKYGNVNPWRYCVDVFDHLSIAALVDNRILCVHGGLSPDLVDIQQLAQIQRPCDIPDQGLLCDLLWSDPDQDIVGWGQNDRGVSYTFGPDVVSNFLQKHDFDLICRAHQVVEDGYEFFAKRQLVTLFSAPNYCGEFDNAGAMMSIDETLMCSFQILKPADKKARYAYGGQGNKGPRRLRAGLLGSETRRRAKRR